MPIIIILLTITTIAGWSVAAWLIRRSTKNAEGTGATTLTADDFTLDLADLATNLALQATLDGVFRAAGEWLCNAGKYSYIIFYVYDHASHELTNPMVVGREMPNLPRRLRLVANAYGGVLNTRQPHLAQWPCPQSKLWTDQPGCPECVYRSALSVGCRARCHVSAICST